MPKSSEQWAESLMCVAGQAWSEAKGNPPINNGHYPRFTYDEDEAKDLGKHLKTGLDKNDLEEVIERSWSDTRYDTTMKSGRYHFQPLPTL